MAAEPPALDPGTIVGGKYRVDGLLGKGGMGAVFQATNISIGRRVAIKVLVAKAADRDEVARRFELEARAAALIGHPGIVDVLDLGETDDGEPFIVMEYLEGATVKGVFKRLGGFNPAQAVAVTSPVLDALAAAHRAGVIHRDVKPANIFVCTRPTQTIKLLDFGVSRFGKSSGLTLSGTAVGTPKYMAPEQVLGEKELGPEADLYSVGAVMYQLLSGKPPYEADSDIATLARILSEVHQPLHKVRPELPEALCAWVDALLIKEPTRRPSDAARVRQALLDLVPEVDSAAVYAAAAQAAKLYASSATPSPSPGLPRSKPSSPSVRRRQAVEEPPKSRAPLLAGLAATVVLLLGVGGAVLLRQPVPAPAPLPAAPAPPRSFTVTLSAEPAEARFTVNGQEMDCNPCTLARASGATATVRVLAPRFSVSELELVFDRDRTQHVTLVPVPPAATPDAGKAGHPRRPGALNVDERNPYQ